jgi:hypothetical protein
MLGNAAEQAGGMALQMRVRRLWLGAADLSEMAETDGLSLLSD